MVSLAAYLLEASYGAAQSPWSQYAVPVGGSDQVTIFPVELLAFLEGVYGHIAII